MMQRLRNLLPMKILTKLVLTFASGFALGYLSKHQPGPNRKSREPSPTMVAEATLLEQLSEVPQAPTVPTIDEATSRELSFAGKVTDIFTSTRASIKRLPSAVKSFLFAKDHPVPFLPRWLTVLFFSLILIGPALSHLGLHVEHPVRRFGAGLFLTIYTLGAWVTITALTKSLMKWVWPDFLDRNKLSAALQIFGFAVIIFAGAWAWCVGWTGKNVGLPFGAGAFLCGIIFQHGPNRLAEYYSPSLNQEQRSELQDLLDLTSVQKNSNANAVRIAEIRKKWGL